MDENDDGPEVGGTRNTFILVDLTGLYLPKWPAKLGYWGSLHTYAYTIWPTVVKFGMLTHVGRGLFYGVSHASITRGWTPSAPKFSWDPLPMSMPFDTECPDGISCPSTEEACFMLEHAPAT